MVAVTICRAQLSFQRASVFYFISAVTVYSDFGIKKIKQNKISVTASTFYLFICYEVMGLDAMILVF